MRKTTTTTMALVATLALIGIGSMPVQAVPADCDKQFTISSTEPQTPTTLPADSSKVGKIELDEDATVTVRVDSPTSALDFGVFFLDDQDCKVAANEIPSMSDCDDQEAIVTGLLTFPQEELCDLNPQGGTAEFYFHLVNDSGSALDYSIWRSD